MRSRKQPRDRVKNKARQSREQKSAARSTTTIRNKQPCAARDSEKAPKHKRLPRSCSTSMCCERFREGPKHKRIPRSCSTSTCCERFRERPKAQAFTRILFNVYVLPAIQTRPQSTSVYPCSTSICCEIFGEGPKTQAFTPILFNIYVLLGIYRKPQSISAYPNLLQYLRAARDLKNASDHKRLPLSCSTSACCERFREGPKTQAFTRSCSTFMYCERRLQNTGVTRSCSTSMCSEIFKEGLRAQAFTPMLFNIYVLREIGRRPQNKAVYPFHFV